mgnify:FL=1
MINENRLYKDITGMEKILSIHPQFSWKKIKYIEAFNYYIDLNEFGERSSYLKVLFGLELSNHGLMKACFKFNGINNLIMRSIGGKYNQIMGFEIIDRLFLGWDLEQRYLVRDYENGTIEFSCKAIELLQVDI